MSEQDKDLTSLREIAEKLGISKQRVLQIVQSGLAKLRRIHSGGELYDLDNFEKAAARYGSNFEPKLGKESEAEYQLRFPEPTGCLDYHEPVRDYDIANTFVISGPLGDTKFPGRRFACLDDAREYWSARTAIREEITVVPGRWIFRIDKPKGDSQ